MTTQITIEGARRFRRTMKQAGVDMQEMKDAHAEVASMVVGVTRVPRRTGRLAATLRGSGTTSAAIVRAGYTSVPYAPPVHFGWPEKHIPAQPFITDAARKTEPRWLLVYKRHIDRILTKIKGV